ncbi:MAG: carboxyltransferase domain-containing protein [Firmicutes bacterium]|nr:carboxyltransferase domain-containing protein [Bacillota bacterium]
MKVDAGDLWTKATWLSDCVMLLPSVPYALQVALIREPRPDGIVDVVAGGDDVAIYLVDPHVGLDVVEAFVRKVLTARNVQSCAQKDVREGTETTYAPENRHVFTVHYGGPNTDLDEVADRLSIAVPALIRLHTGTPYRVVSTGFSPGFAYCGPLPERLWLKRKAVPRLDVQAGAVAIAVGYTGVYPRMGAGGWWILGYLSPEQVQSLWTWEADPPARLRLGDEVHFVESE